MSGVIDTSVFTEDELDDLAKYARAEEEEREGKCYHCHKMTQASSASRCKHCKTAIYCNRACRVAGKPLHRQPCFLRIRMSIRLPLAGRDGGFMRRALPWWYLERVLHVHERAGEHFAGSMLLFMHREAQIASVMPAFKKSIMVPEDAWPRKEWGDADLTEDEQDSNRHMFLGLLPCKPFVLATLAKYPSVAMCVAANSVYTPDTLTVLVFFIGSEWQFASVKFDWSKPHQGDHAVGFNYASDAHKTHTSQK